MALMSKTGTSQATPLRARPILISGATFRRKSMRARNVRWIKHHYFHGYHVRVKRGGRRWQRYVNADRFPSRRAAFEEALHIRNRIESRLPPPVKIHRRSSRSSTGIVGVSRPRERTRSGKRFERYVARCYDSHGRVCKRSFSVSFYGEAKARMLAVQAREKGVRLLMEARARQIRSTRT